MTEATLIVEQIRAYLRAQGEDRFKDLTHRSAIDDEVASGDVTCEVGGEADLDHVGRLVMTFGAAREAWRYSPFLHPVAMDERLARNLGPTSRAWLADIGVTTLAEVRRRGVLATCHQVRAYGHRASFNLVLALQGALMDCDWRAVPAEIRERLRAEWDA